MAHSQTSSPTSFNRSPLVQLLASLQRPGTAASTQTLAERLGHWVAWKDAIGLSNALDARPVAPLSVERANADAIAGVTASVHRVRVELAARINEDPVFANGASVAKRSRAGATGEVATGEGSPATDFASYRHSYLTHQSVMDERIGRLRAEVRTALAGAGAALARLAALDAAMDQALAAHQRRVAGQVPKMLEQHVKRQQAARAQPMAETQGTVSTARQAASQQAVGATVQQALLAELTFRLQPVMGMVEALGANATTNA